MTSKPMQFIKAAMAYEAPDAAWQKA